MRALGFCVSSAHAEFMAAQFSELGLDSVAIRVDARRRTTGCITSSSSRHHRCIFSVDVLGEAVDLPNVDTVLLLRPTQPATVFAQQLGRGLTDASLRICSSARTSRGLRRFQSVHPLGSTTYGVRTGVPLPSCRRFMLPTTEMLLPFKGYVSPFPPPHGCSSVGDRVRLDDASRPPTGAGLRRTAGRQRGSSPIAARSARTRARRPPSASDRTGIGFRPGCRTRLRSRRAPRPVLAEAL